MASAVFADGQRTRGPTLQQGRVRMVQTRTNPGDSPCQYPCVQQFLFCYLAKVETHEESAFILRKFTASSKCPNVWNTHVDVWSPYVDIWSADFYIAPAYLGACVRVLTRMPTAYYLSLVWYDVYYIRNLLSSYKNNHRLQKVLLSEVLTSITYTNLYTKCRLLSSWRAYQGERVCWPACLSVSKSVLSCWFKKNLNKHWIFNCDPRFYVPKDKLKKTKKQITLFRVPVLYSNTFFDIRKREVLCSMNSE